MSHPSYLALDAHALDPRADELAEHVKSCARCQAHLAAARAPVPFPSALRALEVERPAQAPWWRRLALGFATACVLLTAGLALRQPPPPSTAKGTPVAALWLNRGGKVMAWNGQPVLAGDAVRFEVAPAGLTHVTVFDEQSKQVLYEAQVPDGVSTLTPAWQLDGHAPSESLRVVLSRGPVDAAVLQAASCSAEAQTHCTRFTLSRGTP